MSLDTFADILTKRGYTDSQITTLNRIGYRREKAITELKSGRIMAENDAVLYSVGRRKTLEYLII